MSIDRGEAEIILGGQRYRLKMGSGALIAMQERLSTSDHLIPVQDIFEGSARGRVLYTRTILWAALRKYHAEITETQIEDILDAASIEEVRDMHLALTGQTLPDPRDVTDLEDGARPLSRRRTRRVNGRAVGTGEGSTSTPDASASTRMRSGT